MGEFAKNGRLTSSQLAGLVESNEVDTVLVAMVDMQGRLQGKRCDARYFIDEILTSSAEACSYLLGVDVDMNTVGGYAITSWDSGYGDFVMRVDPASFRLVPWHPKTAICHADVLYQGQKMVEQAPRTILKRQLERLSALGYSAYVGTELEFIVFKESYEDAWNGGYRQMTPVNLYNVDYSLLGTGRIEPLLHRIRNEMSGAGMSVESVKGECNFGQHELAFKYAEALEKADEHALFKLGAKEIASQEGYSLTFMAKYNEREGNSCHIHMSLRDENGRSVFQDQQSKGPIPGGSKVFEHFLAGQLATLSELSLMFAPNINSYKRYVKGSFAPTAVAWGIDNRTCAFRVVGHGPALRLENRIPGGDVNPYLAIAAMVAGGLHGIENELELPAKTSGNAYIGDAERVPSSLKDAAESFANSAIARSAFGQEVVDHYLNMAEIEISAFEAAVTDWERFRSFERL